MSKILKAATMPDSRFVEAEKQSGLALNDEQRDRIKKYVSVYHFWTLVRRNLPTNADRRRIESAVKHIDELCELVKHLAESGFWPCPSDHIPSIELDQLLDLRGIFCEMRKMSGRGRPDRRAELAILLFRLESIFLEAGGRNTATVKEGGLRGGKFVKFAWPIIEWIPASMRPYSESALASAWEEIRPLRLSSPLGNHEMFTAVAFWPCLEGYYHRARRDLGN